MSSVIYPTRGGVASSSSGGWQDAEGSPIIPVDQNVIDISHDLENYDLELSGLLSNAGGAGGYDILPRINGSTSNFQIIRVEERAGTPTGNPTSGDGIASCGAGDIFDIRHVRFFGAGAIASAKRGWGEFLIVRDTGGTPYKYRGTFEWNVTGTAGSSAGLQAGLGAGLFKTGKLWKRRRLRA